MIDNFDKLIKHLNFKSEDTFYHLQIIIRKKDKGNTTNKHCKLVRSYFIESREQLLHNREDIIKLCKVFNARAYINLNSKSYKQCMLEGLKQISKDIYEENYRKIILVKDTVAGTYVDKHQIRWIVDIDKDEHIKYVNVIADYINNLRPLNSVVDIIDTVSGKHIITDRFDTREFKKTYPNIDIHKNNPTILYYDK